MIESDGGTEFYPHSWLLDCRFCGQQGRIVDPVFTDRRNKNGADLPPHTDFIARVVCYRCMNVWLIGHEPQLVQELEDGRHLGYGPEAA